MSDVSAIISELTDHGFEDTSNERKLAVINDTIWDIESRQDWPFNIKTINLTFSGSADTPTNMPADFSKVKYITDSVNGYFLRHERLETFRNNYGATSTATGDPILFYFLGPTINFYPLPPASTTRYVMDYYATQPKVTETTLEAAINMPPRHHRVIVLGAVSKLYKLEDDAELAGVFATEYEQRLQTMTYDLMKQQFQNPDNIFVIDEYDEW